MEISKAALPPRQPHISQQDRSHPLFPIYARHRASMSAQLVEVSSLQDWKYQYERNVRETALTKHERFPEFLSWMQATKGGARTCPAGSFPHNFLFWLEGGRW